MEGLGGTACWHVHNSAYSIGPGSCPSAPSGTSGWGGGWHTFAVDWTPGSATFYYDGKNVGTETSSEMGDATPLGAYAKYLVLGMQTDGKTELTYPATMYVDYVRVWQ
jgi:beta-glucanase (GH16 family)